MDSFPVNMLIFTIPVLVQIAFVFGLIVVIRRVVKRNNEGIDGFTSSRNALKILDERFARGEIDEIEYIRKKDMLSKP